MREASAIAAWDEVADLYGAGSSPFSQFAERLAGWAGVEPGERVLDLGCGNGLGLAILTRAGAAALVGVDFSPDMLRAARRRLAPSGGGAALARADGEALPFPSGSFDVAMASSVFQFVGYSVAVLEEWRRVLRDHGRLLLSTPAGPGDDAPDVNPTLMREFFPRLPDDAKQRLARMPRAPSAPPDLAECCRRAGFAGAEVVEVEFETSVANREAWWDLQWTHGFRGFLREFDPVALAEMKARAFELLAPRCTPTGAVRGTQIFHFCRAR